MIPSHGLYETVRNYQDIREKKAVRYRKTLLRYRPGIHQRLGYFKHIASAYQKSMFKFKTHEEDPSLLNAFLKASFKLLVDAIEQGFLFQTRRKQIKESVRDKEPTYRKAEPQPSDGIFWSMHFKINQK